MRNRTESDRFERVYYMTSEAGPTQLANKVDFYIYRFKVKIKKSVLDILATVKSSWSSRLKTGCDEGNYVAISQVESATIAGLSKQRVQNQKDYHSLPCFCHGVIKQKWVRGKRLWSY